MLDGVHGWLELHARTIAAVVLVALAVTLVRNGVARFAG